MQCGGGKEKGREEKDTEAGNNAEGRESYQKENVEDEEEEEELNSSETYRGKQLPPGMKLKKRVTDEERKSPKANSVAKVTDKMQDKTGENHKEQRKIEKAISDSSVKAGHSDKMNKTSQDPHKDQEPNTGEPCLEKQADPIVKESASKSSPSSSTQAPRDSAVSKRPTSNEPTQSDSSQIQNNHDDEDSDSDDGVVLVSEKPAANKTPVQKTLTTFPGFQPACKVKGQQGDPRGLHNLLTAQLQQKKVSEGLTLKRHDWLCGQIFESDICHIRATPGYRLELEKILCF